MPDLKRHEEILGNEFEKEDDTKNATKNCKMEPDYTHPHPCILCDKIFITVMGLSQHMKITHPKDDGKSKKKKPGFKHQCLLCKRKFLNKGALLLHGELDHPQSPKDCGPGKSERKTREINTNATKNAKSLQKLSLVLEKEDNTPTPVRKGLAIHENTTKNATKSKFKWICPTCSMDFKFGEQMQTHFSMVHEGKKPYECSECGKGYTLTRNMERHFTKAHKGISYERKKGVELQQKERKFHCGICDKAFMRQENLNRHMSAIHEGKRPFKCSACELAFTMKCALKKHFENKHDDK